MNYTSYYSILMSDFITGSETSNESDHGDVSQQLSDLPACYDPDADGSLNNQQKDPEFDKIAPLPKHVSRISFTYGCQNS